MADENLERFKRGAFLSLKAAALTEPKHNAKYNEIQSTMLKAQGLVFVFSLFWARIIEQSNIYRPKSRWPYYIAFVGIPSALHGFYVSSFFGDYVFKLDKIYSEMYFKTFEPQNIASLKN